MDQGDATLEVAGWHRPDLLISNREVVFVPLKPVGARVLIRPMTEEEAPRSSGLVLPDTAKEKNPVQYGTVVAAGSGALSETGERFPVQVKEGDRVLYLRFSGIPINVDGEELYAINEAQIVAVVEE